LALQEYYSGEVVFIVADLDNPETEKLLEEFIVLYIPVFFFIDQKGAIIAEEAGVFNFEEMVQLIEPVIGDRVNDEEKSVSPLETFFSETIPWVVEQRSLLTLALVFIGGLVTSISPCVLSMVPLLVSYIGGYAEGPRYRGFILSSSFVIGLAVTFAVLGFVAAFFGRIFGQVDAVWYYILAGVAIIMGLQLLGVLTLNLPGLNKIPLKKAGLAGSLVMGMFFGLVASPCATPVLAVIITYAAVQAEPFYGSGLLFIYGIGHGVPLIAAGTFTGIAKSVPMINKYTHYLSYASGIILVVFGLILLAWIRWL